MIPSPTRFPGERASRLREAQPLTWAEHLGSGLARMRAQALLTPSLCVVSSSSLPLTFGFEESWLSKWRAQVSLRAQETLATGSACDLLSLEAETARGAGEIPVAVTS